MYFSYARGVGSEHISTSAKTGAGVIELFSNLSKSMDFQLSYSFNRDNKCIIK